MLYIIDKDHLSIKDIIQSSADTINTNINLNGKSTFTLLGSPNIKSGDYLIQKKGNTTPINKNKNLFDNSKLTEGFLNLATGEYEMLSEYPNSVYGTPIKVESGVTYYISGITGDHRIRQYSTTGDYIGSMNLNPPQAVIVNDDMYLVPLFFNGLSELELRRLQIEVGNEATPYQSFIPEKDISDIAYQGIISDYENEKDSMATLINTKELESLFDRKLILSNEEIIKDVGIEDFVRKIILDEFVKSNDTLLNITYIFPWVITHTKLNISVDVDDDGIYNFQTFLGNIKETYNIHLDYIFDGGTLLILISNKDDNALEIDTSLSDVISFKEVYKTNAVAKVTVIVTDVTPQTTHDYFLLTDRTISDDINNPNRAKGDVDIVTCQNEEDVYQRAVDAFKGNSYQHNVVLTLTKTSKLYLLSDFYVGRQLRIKTKSNGIYDTFISAIDTKSNSNIYTVTCGNMKVTLLEKLKGVI